MRILKFNEAEEDLTISNERIIEIVEKLNLIISEVDNNVREIDSISGELSNYRSKSKKSNNQIDDASLSIDSVKSKLEESTSLIDSIIKLLEDYSEGGEKYLY